MKKSGDYFIHRLMACQTLKERVMVRAWFLFNYTSIRDDWWGDFRKCLSRAWVIEKEDWNKPAEPKSVQYSEGCQRDIQAMYSSGRYMGD